MTMQEPKVEVIEIDLKEAVVADSTTGGGQYCTGSEPDAKYCPGWAGAVDWSQPMN